MFYSTLLKHEFREVFSKAKPRTQKNNEQLIIMINFYAYKGYYNG